jgi:enterochelin esterase family protein
MPYFSREFLNNKFFIEQPLSFDHMGLYEDGTQAGAFAQPNGNVLVRMHICGGNSVRLKISVSNKVGAEIELANMGADVFEGVIPFDESMTGPANVKVYVNGAEVLSPDLPIIWTDNRPQNNIELPDPEDDYLLVKNVSHGTYSRELIYSHSTGSWERCMVYTPPGYRAGNTRYPVLYLLHGGGDNEMMWEYVGRMSSILDNLWAEDKAEKFLVVTMNGMLREGGRVGMPVDRVFENMLIRDCIPFIDKNYRTLTDKWHRAIAGLSMGAYMSCDIGFGNPDLFGSIGAFTASMTSDPDMMTYERPYPEILKAY